MKARHKMLRLFFEKILTFASKSIMIWCSFSVYLSC